MKHHGKNVPENRREIGRATRSRAEARTAYDRISKWYDILAGPFEKKCRDVGLQKLGVREGDQVLEVGFGTGHSTAALAQSVGSSGRVYGIDISAGMCNITRTRLKKAGLSKRVALVCGDAITLPFKTAFLHGVFMSFALELFDTRDILTVLDECQKILRNNGRICVVAMSNKGKPGLMNRLYEWLHKKVPSYFDCRPICVHEVVQQAGFQIVSVTEMSMCGLPVEIVVAKKA